jgi:hypothetical protein
LNHIYPGGAVGHLSSAVTAPINKAIIQQLQRKYFSGISNAKYICNALAIPELFFASGMARGINPCLAAGDKMDSPITKQEM